MSADKVPEILINDFRRDPEELIAAQMSATERVLRSGWYVLGPEVKSFEKEWAAFTGLNFAVGTGNGMDAIEIGLRALGIGPGDEVITTGMSAFATVLGITRAGATPVLADIDPATGLLDVDSAARCTTERTRAIMPVHMYGHVRGMDRWQALCSERGLKLVEDCAQSHGATEHGIPAGGFGEWGAYSFYPTKNLGAVGDGGSLNCNSEAIAFSAARLRNYGQSERYHHPLLGLNSRLDELQAAILSERLKFLPAFTKRRKAIAARYHAGIKGGKVRPLAPPLEDSAHVYHLFVVLCSERNRLQQELESRGVQTLVHYPVPVHMQPPYRDIQRDPDGLGNTERHAEQCLSIPCHPHLTDSEVDTIIQVISDFN